MLSSLWLLAAVGLTSVSCADEITPKTGEACGYESCTSAKSDMLNVHIVPHSHQDVGYQKTAEQYYYGTRSLVQKAGVQYILNSVVQELWEDSKRRFVYVETYYFWKWWNKQGADVRSKVHTLVRQGRLKFAGGGWSMNDEAITHYQSTIDHFTLGLRKLNDTFGACGVPRVGWQVDPFGHSKEFTSLLSSMGYDGLFVGRIDTQDIESRISDGRMEMVWRGDNVLGNSSDLFTGVLFNSYYSPPGYCFDVLCFDSPIVDDPTSSAYNMDDRIDPLLDYVEFQANSYSTNNILITMGDDFTYTDAGMWYTNLDKLIKYSNQKSTAGGRNINMFYSTPDCFLKAIKDANPTLPTKEDDFLPYASNDHSYWAGFYTSRPALKRYEREVNNDLQMMKHLQVLGNLTVDNQLHLDKLKSAMGITQTHEVITGTSKQDVADDVVRILYKSVSEALVVPRQALNKFITGDSESQLLSFGRCKLNESSCPIAEESAQFVVSIYNPLGWAIQEPVGIPVKEGTYEVYDYNGNKVMSQLQYIPDAVQNLPLRASNATRVVLFIAELDPLGVKSYYVKKTSSVDTGTSANITQLGEDYILDNNVMQVRVDKNSGEISQIITTNWTADFSVKAGYWVSFLGDDSHPVNRSSNSYVFRPRDTDPVNVPYKTKIKIVPGAVANEVWLETDGNVFSVFRVYKGINYLEHDYVVGPIDVSDNVNKEYIFRYQTDLNTSGVFFTDANGRQLVQRELNKRPQRNLTILEPVSGNYYPVSNVLAVSEGSLAVAVITDRSQGGTSLTGGQMELMVHRRMLHTTDPMDEMVNGGGLVVRGTHRIMKLHRDNADQEVQLRKEVLQTSLRPILFVSNADQITLDAWKNLTNRYVGVNALPLGVHLLTLESWNTKELLVRLENINLRATQTLNLSTIFNSFKVTGFKETTLAGNRWLKDTQKWTWGHDNDFSATPYTIPSVPDDSGYTIYIKPRQIRTFIVSYDYIKS